MATLTGTAGADLLQGTEGADSLAGLGGDDTLVGGAGNDTLDGGAGHDRAVIDRSASTAAITFYMLAPGLVSQVAGTSVTGVEHLSFTAGSGNDGLAGGAGDDSFAGGAGSDALQGLAGADTLLGGDGADTLLGGAGADLLTGGAGADRFILQGSGGLDSSLAFPDRIADFNAGDGDLLVLRGEAIGAGLLPLATGSFGLSGGASLPVGFGGALAARVAPVAGMALPDATGGQGLTLHWQPGLAAGGWLLLDLDGDGLLGTADLVVRFDLPTWQAIGAGSFVAGTFSTLGTAGADSLVGTAGADRIHGFAGADALAGLDGDDTLLGGDGADVLLGGTGFDSLVGGEGGDSLDGGDGTDVLDGGNGDDGLAGGVGDDLLLGGAGNDWLQGGDGNDSLQGGFGADRLEGGPGADTLLLHGMGQASWSTLGAMDTVIGFSRADGDRLRISNAWFGRADGSGADAGLYAGTDGIARPLVFSGSIGAAGAAPVAGMALPAQRLDAYQAYWLPGQDGGGWLVLDLDRNGQLDATDLAVRLDGVGTLGVADFVDGTFLRLDGGYSVGGTAGDDSLQGGSLAETFLGSLGNDRIAGGAGAGNALSYAGLSGPVAVTIAGYGAGTAVKPGGGVDSFTGIQVIAGTAGADTLDAGGATAGFFALSLEGRAGADRIIGNRTTAVQLSYGASPTAVLVDLQGGTAQDGWGSIDTLVDIRRVAALSAHGDTVLGSAWEDVFLSGQSGNKSFDGRAGQDEWRYAGDGAITAMLATTTVQGFVLGPYVLKPGGTDRLTSIEIVTAGAGHDSLHGSAADERLAGGAGNDTIDGAGGFGTVSYDTGGLATQGVVANLTAGIGQDQWGGTDVLRNVEFLWGSALGDDLTGLAIGAYAWLRGLAGNDTLRAPALGTWVGADYAGDPGAIDADLAAGTVRDGWGGIDRLVSIGLIRGSAFADTIAGGAGAETLIGGLGDDTYRVGPGDQVVEAPGEGFDTVIADRPYALPADVEALVLANLAGSSANGWGNGLANLMVSQAGADAMDGGDGQDTLQGGDGADTLYGSGGDDLLAGEAGNDALLAGPGADTLLGGGGDDVLISEADGRFTGTLLLDAGEAAPRIISLADIGTLADSVDGGAGYDRWGAGSIGMLLDLRGAAGMMLGMEEINGSAGNDVLLLAAGQPATTLNGGAGDDTLSGSGSGDWIDGGDGDDLVAGQGGDDSLHGGMGRDTLIGGAGADRLDGGDGDDLLDGGAGADTQYGGIGADTLRGGAEGDWLDGGDGGDSLSGGDGEDRLAGGLGDDALLGDAGADQLDGGDGSDRLDGGDGEDRLAGGLGDDTLLGDAGADQLDGGDGSDRLEGGDGADALLGGAGEDTLQGGTGNDRLDGQTGRNSLEGGLGDDTLVSTDWDALLDGGEDNDLALIDRSTAGAGLVLDMAVGSLTDGVHATLLRGIERLEVTGGAGADRLTGGAGADSLAGGAGDDTLDGGAGSDRLAGGLGNDLYHVDTAGDRVTEAAGEGRDTVVAAIDIVLPTHVEVLVLAAGALRGTGNALANLITGNDAPNILGGGAGNDTLVGGGGMDRLLGGDGDDLLDGASGLGEMDWLAGGAGHDTYRVDSAADQVVEAAGGGIDAVFADIAGGRYILPSNAERLVLLGTTRIGQGNALDNAITGNAAANWLMGGAGEDTLDGGGGNDVLLGGTGADLFLFAPGGGADRIGDFTPGLDHIRLGGVAGFTAVLAAATDRPGGVVIDLGQGDSLTLAGIARSALSAGDFLFG
ncbi:calcium-binding protein [Belnapia sp. F-4-1]|uniref:calcium-binding protein n=1 Tax=Belnapia sp. F-4-1 TaxID=1545443 RepID=UPI0005B9DC90|nr:calcium-binding protein [Belnapia sp. F-4-1]